MAIVNGSPTLNFPDTLTGTPGADTIDGKTGADTMSGGAGNDVYIVDNVGDVVIENMGEGTDLIKSSVSIGALADNVENLSLTGTLGLNATGNALTNIITGNNGANILNGGGGGEVDTLIGGGGNDTYFVDNGADVLTDTAGIETVNSSVSWTLATGFENLTGTGMGDIILTGNGVANTITANDGSNVLNGLVGNDVLIGGTGNDRLDGGVGNDNMTGGDGGDTYVVGEAGDVINEAGATGTDQVEASITHTLGANLENLTLTGVGNINGTGNASVNTITGNTGNNTLTGLAGNDTLISGGGNDRLVGGADDDYYYADNTDTVVENGGEGNDTVETFTSFTLSTDVENLILAAGADGNFILTGNGGANTITNDSSDSATLQGLGGDDILIATGTDDNTFDGGTGLDTMTGGDGDSTYIVDNAGDIINENMGGGTDTILTGISRTLDDNVENATLTGGDSVNLIGNELDNNLVGNGGVNLLLGNLGNDTLNGMAGADIMIGGDGDDQYTVDNAGDTVTENPGEGTDQVTSSVTYTLGADLENLILAMGAGNINATGNAGDNTIFGNDGDNLIDGGGSVTGDRMNGGAGNDTYVVRSLNDLIGETSGLGTDTVQTHVDLGTADLYGNVENLLLADAAIVNGFGNALNNTITGNAIANSLDGKGGDDVLIGGAGDDDYYVDTAADLIVDSSGTADVVHSTAASFNMALRAANVEIGFVEGAGIALIGNNLNNTLTGSAGNNTLDGGLGDDELIGNGGNDLFIVNSVGDTVTGNAGLFDTISSSIDWSLVGNADIENLTITGSATNATGNAANNTITGNSGDNYLNGLAGADVMIGGAGSDAYYVDNVGDNAVEAANEGTNDVVYTTVNFTLGANIESLELTLTGLTGTGNGSNNTITGFSTGASNMFGAGGDDNLIGGTGDDTLDGGTGADFLIGYNGVNVYFVDQVGGLGVGDFVDNSGGSLSSVVNSTVTWDLGDGNASVNVAILNLIGTDNVNGFGRNGSAETLTGNSGNNTLDGRSGADTMEGAGGNDTFIVDNGADVATDSSGTDIVLASTTYTIGTGIDNLTLTGGGDIGGTGNTLANTITGNTGGNALSGGVDAVADTLIGGSGTDFYTVYGNEDVVSETGVNGGEIDTVTVNHTNGAFNYTLGANVENGIIAAGPDVGGTTLTGNSLNNFLQNNNADNNHTLDGGAGSDILIGHNGSNDVFVVDTTSDSVNGQGGTDLILSSVSFFLGSAASVENLTLRAGFATALNATGDGNANIINGNEFANTLDGGAGVDTLIGNGGTDTYIVDDIADVVTGAVGDTILSSVTRTLGTNSTGASNLTLTGGGNINAIGDGNANTLVGNTGDNTLDGMGGADHMSGGDGSDSYYVDNAGDVVSETGTGIDTVYSTVAVTLGNNVENLVSIATSGGITFNGNALNNQMTASTAFGVIFNGLGGSDTLTGNTGNDTLDGGLSSDTMVGGDGDDTYFVNAGGDVVTEVVGEGTDTVNSSISLTLGANVDNLVLIEGAGNLSGTGNGDVNTITGNSGNNILAGLGGTDLMIGGAGNDTYITDVAGLVEIAVDTAGTDSVEASTGDVDLSARLDLENVTVSGATNQNITGNSNVNVLAGDNTNNTLDGGTGADSLFGGGGDDTYIVDNVGDLVTDTTGATDTVITSVSFTLGTTIEVGEAAASGITITGGTNVNTLDTTGFAGNTLNGGAGADIMIGSAGDDTFVVDDVGDTVTGAGGIDTVRSSITFDLAVGGATHLVLTGGNNIHGLGTGANNTITGNTGANSLDGGAGADFLDGGDGNDTLQGGLGADAMTGGLGNDLFFVDDAGDTVTEAANGGTDTISSELDFSLNVAGLNVEHLTLTGGTAVFATGNASSNNLTGNALNNTIDGLGGADAMSGGAGDDVYTVDNVGDQVFENLGEGTDVVNSTVSFTLGANVDNLVLTPGAGNINGTGNADANTITGNEGNNTLDGGAGADILSGGGGDDTYVTDQPGDVLNEAPAGGTDTVRAGYTYALQTDFENLTLTGTGNFDATGNTVGNVIVGNSGNNTIDGGLGADAMSGGAGDDYFLVDDAGDTVSENAGEGTDTVETLVSFTLANNVDILFAGIGAADNITLTGNSVGNNIIATNASGATLDGGGGADMLIGGVSSEVFVVDNVNDTVISGGGADTINSSITRDLNVNSGGVTRLLLTGGANINGTGTGGNDIITGNTGVNVLTGAAGNDTLDGGAGADTLIGGSGTDLYIVDNINDKITEIAGDSNADTVQASVTHILAANVENLTLNAGFVNINGTGNGLNNTIIVNTGFSTNTVDGGLGADTMSNIGAFNNVTFIVDNAGDTVVGSNNNGTDNVRSSVSFTLGADVDNLLLTGTAAINGTGNVLANTLTGNTGANILDDGGAGGADVMQGGGGNDTYNVNNTGNVITDTSGIDTVNSTVSFDLSTNGTAVEKLNLLGGNDIDATGNTLANTLTGNTGENSLFGLGGNDILLGGLDDDFLDGGIGRDTLTGGTGSDVFHFSGAITLANSDIITDFQNGGGNDALDISDILIGYNGNVTEFVQITQSGANTIVKVDVNGLAGGTSWVQVAQLNNVNLGTDEAALVGTGNLVVT